MTSQQIALLIAGGGLVLGMARFGISVLTYRLDSERAERQRAQAAEPATRTPDEPSTETRADPEAA